MLVFIDHPNVVVKPPPHTTSSPQYGEGAVDNLSSLCPEQFFWCGSTQDPAGGPVSDWGACTPGLLQMASTQVPGSRVLIPVNVQSVVLIVWPSLQNPDTQTISVSECGVSEGNMFLNTLQFIGVKRFPVSKTSVFEAEIKDLTRDRCHRPARLSCQQDSH